MRITLRYETLRFHGCHCEVCTASWDVTACSLIYVFQTLRNIKMNLNWLWRGSTYNCHPLVSAVLKLEALLPDCSLLNFLCSWLRSNEIRSAF
jgi:hypothetical protein